ncbi:hypothetical protein BUZ62_11105 [Staphylococcus pasteuri]|uniref:hypothetical protein n=1 Tax=Staphylococcus pasteuri TaxID=45972 RepID=UPI000D3BC6AE|nr:hypothetical protein [Staphylococcus pasteuri]PTU84578.1 hypothetical protein BUZ62_11105 [Staphylococcus pasteuri]
MESNNIGTGLKKTKDKINNSKNTNDFKKQFGASSSVTNNKEDTSENLKPINKKQFGATSKSVKANFITKLLNVFKLDYKIEWLIRYIVSILIFGLHIFLIETKLNMSILILNLILFPFIICIVDHFIRQLWDRSTFFMDYEEWGCLFATVKIVIKYAFLLYVWTYSFILGTIALIYLYFIGRKIG